MANLSERSIHVRGQDEEEKRSSTELILKSADQRIAYLTRNDLPGLSPGLSFSVFNAVGFREEGIDFELILRRASAGNADEIVRHLFEVDINSQLRALHAPRIGKSNCVTLESA